MGLLMICHQMYLLTLKNRIIYLFLLSVAITAVVYESSFIGCTPDNCTLDRNREKVKQSQTSFACQESNRVNWRRAFLISFILFVFMNSISPFETNLFIFIFCLFLTYFYFNFDAYHRFEVACALEKYV